MEAFALAHQFLSCSIIKLSTARVVGNLGRVHVGVIVEAPIWVAALGFLSIGVQGLDHCAHVSCEFIKSFILTDVGKGQFLDLVSETSVELNLVSVIRNSCFTCQQ